MVLYLLLGVLRPLLRQILAHRPPPPAPPSEAPGALDADGQPIAALPNPLDAARARARQDPKAVASVVRNWVNNG